MALNQAKQRAIFTGLVILFLAAGCSRMASNFLKLSPAEHKVKVEKNVMVPMRDGVKLATDIYLPADSPGPFPVILTRLPYNKDYIGAVGKLFAERGYGFVVQDCRATYHSEGEVFIPFVFEHEDGMDTVAWIAKQSWFNGNLGTWGASYFGATQWAIAADNPYLKCFYPQITSARLDKLIFTGGAFSFRLATGWSAGVGKQSKGNSQLLDMGKKVEMATAGFFNAPLKPDLPIDFRELPGLSMADTEKKFAQGMGLPEGQMPPDMVERMMTMMNYPAFAEYADAFNFHDRYQQVTAPALMVSGWYDIFVNGELADFVAMKKTAPGDAGKYTRIIIGPWGHVSGFKPDAGSDAKMGAMMRDLMIFAWFDRWLKGEQNGIEKAAPVKLYVMGKNVWRDENEWPLARTQYTKYYFHGQGRANSLTGDGVLSTEAPGQEPADHFAYDPRNPVLTAGGNNLLEDVGAKDQAAVEKRPDVLVFTTPPLAGEVEVTGPISAVVYAASTARDTDFTVKLCDVYPNGVSYNLQEGIVRARYRESTLQPSLIEPGKIYEYHIEMWATSNCFLKGHRIRVQVASSSFPRFDRNTNAGGEGGPMNIIIANQSIYHDQEHPSHVLLPVIP